MAERNIIQIMPAAGWAAVLDEGGEETITPLVGWALVQQGQSTSVVGLLAWERVELADAQPNFSRYVFMTDLFADDEGDDDFDDELDGEEDEDEDEGESFDRKMGRLN
jgi:hypothetical protein